MVGREQNGTTPTARRKKPIDPNDNFLVFSFLLVTTNEVVFHKKAVVKERAVNDALMNEIVKKECQV